MVLTKKYKKKLSKSIKYKGGNNFYFHKELKINNNIFNLYNLIKPYIFQSTIKSFIINDNIKFNPQEYKQLCDNLYNSDNGKLYRFLSNNIVNNSIKTRNKVILYMNFKSHNILIEEKREKLYNIISINKPDIICLSEALLPINIENNKKIINDDDIKITEIDNIKDDTIKQPYNAADQFKEKKIKENGKILELKNNWKTFFIKEGYKYIIFANPTECPWGENWGNCIITKTKPEKIYILQMKSYGKITFNVPESRSMVGIKIDNEYIFSTHLDNVPNSDSRKKQTLEIIDFLNKLKFKKAEITLVGDLNAINKYSYNKEELSILKLLNQNQENLPFDAVELLNNSKLFGNHPINTGQKYESMFQKCVSHAYSNKYSNCIMLFTDSTDFDHQPMLIF